MRKKFLIILLSLPLILGIERFCHAKTDGFAIVNIASPLPPNPKWNVENLAGWETVLEQEYSYLACGAQNYVFASTDGRYVIKFFKHQHMRVPPLLQKLGLYTEAKQVKKRAVQEETFASMKIAFDFLREETALVALHLNKSSHLPNRLTITDKIGVKHEINPNDFEFVVQRKGVLAFEKIEKWQLAGKKEKVEEALNEMITYSKKRIARGIFDKDPDFATNFGIIDGKIVQIDIGRFSMQKEEDLNELYRITRPLEEKYGKISL